MYKFIKDNIHSLKKEEIKEIIELLINIYNDNSNILVPLDNNKYRIINANDILYVERPKRDNYIIALTNEDIRFKNNAFDIANYLMELDSNFKCLNNGLWANVAKIRYYDSYYKRIYFSDEKYVDVTSAAINNIVKKYLGVAKDIYLNSERSKIEYYPLSKRRLI